MKVLPLALALLGGVSAPGGVDIAARATRADQVHAGAAPTIRYQERVLPNGLRVYSLVDRSTTSVAVQIWYGVGAKNDPPGRSGMAHLCEHLMFKGSRDLPPEFIDRLTDDVGGQNDASTDSDDTEYDEIAPANYLERLLWAEAKRMTSLDPSAADFIAERRVVEQELQQDVLTNPYSRLFEIEAPRASSAPALYRQSVIGSLDEIEAATPAELRAFHARYYRPDNASLVVVGDFDPPQLNRWIDKYFGPIPRPPTPIPEAASNEPVRRAHRVVDSYAPDAPLPALLLTYPGPPAASPDGAALKVLDAVLTLGETSRLDVDLVSKRGLANSTFSEVSQWQQAGLIEVGATLADGVSMTRGEAALRTELAGLRDGGVSKSEVLAAKNQLLAKVLRDRETIDGVANSIGEASILDGDAGHVNSDVAALEAVTAAEVRRVADKYLVDARRTTIRYHAAASVGVSRRAPSPLYSAPVATRAVTAFAPDETARRAPAPPPAGPAIAPVAPRLLERTLPNGMRVIVARTGSQPIATAELTFAGGSALDPRGKAGLAFVTAMLAKRGRDAPAAIERTRRIAQLGDVLATATDYDSTSFRLSGLAASLPAGLGILAEIVRRPQIGKAELYDLGQPLSGESGFAGLDDDTVSDAAVNQLVFGGGAYGHLASGAPTPSATITAADVRRESAALYRPQDAILVVTGGVNPAATLALAAQVFSDWKRSPAPPPPRPSVGAARPGRVVAIDVPGLEEATVTVASRSITRSNPSYYAVELANELLGGGESSRLSADIRVRRGLTYDASSEVDEYRDAGLFTASVQTAVGAAPDVAALLLGQLTALARAAPSADELAARKAELVGDFYRGSATSEGLADLLTKDALYGVDLTEISSYAKRVGAVSAADVQAAAKQLADPAAAVVVIVGDAARFMPALRARFPGARLTRPDGLQSMLAMGR